jgi:hypothetical protein
VHRCQDAAVVRKVSNCCCVFDFHGSDRCQLMLKGRRSVNEARAKNVVESTSTGGHGRMAEDGREARTRG